MAKEQAGWDSPENEVQSNWMKFNVSFADDPENCDKIYGVLVDKRTQKSSLDDKEKIQNVYDIKALEATSFHRLDDKKKLVNEPIAIEIGNIYSVGGTAVIDRGMRNIKLGQIIGLKFVEEQAAKVKGRSPTKVIKAYTFKNAEGTGPLMDADWVAEHANDALEAEFHS